MPVLAHSYAHFQPVTGLPYITGIAGSGTGQYWVDQFGQPIMVRSDTSWALPFQAGVTGGSHTWQSDIEDYCTTRAAQGFNAFLAAAPGTPQIGGTQNGYTWDGVAPFTSPGVMSESFWTRVDYVISTAAAHGLSVFFNPMFTYCFTAGGALNGWSSGNFTSYGTALGNRYKAAPNLLWEFGDDYGDGENTAFDACLAAIRAAGDSHLVSVENLSPCTSRKSLADGGTFTWGAANAQFQWCYGYGCAYNAVEYAYLEADPLIVTKMDGYYDQDGVRDYMRKWAWWSLSSGSRGFQYGREALFKWDSGSLAALTTNTTDNSDLKKFWDIFATLPGWHQLVPDTSSALVTAGRGTRWADTNDSFTTSSTNTYVTASKNAAGTLAVIYNPAADTQTITVNGAVMAGGAIGTATWIDPTSGATADAGVSSTYSRSPANSTGGHDWVLALQS